MFKRSFIVQNIGKTLFFCKGGHVTEISYDDGKCPLCGDSTADARVWGVYKTVDSIKFIDFAEVYDNGDKVSLSVGVSKYTYNANVQKIGYAKERIRFTWNAQKGILYFINKKGVRNFSYARPCLIVKEIGDLLAVDLAGNNQTLQRGLAQFFSLCYNKQQQMFGLTFVKQDLDLVCYQDIVEAIRLLTFPALRNAPESVLKGLIDYIPSAKKDKKELRQPNMGLYDILFVLTGTKSKALAKYLHTNSAYVALFVGVAFKGMLSVDSMLKLIEGFKKDWLHLFSNDIERAREAFTFGLSLMHENDLVRRVVKEFYSLMGAVECINRIKELISKILEIKEDFQVPTVKQCGGFREMREHLEREYVRLKQVNRTIPYSEEEYKMETVIDGYEFRLAEDTHRLIEAGQVMHICVGGYADMAVSKRTTIVLVYEENKYVACIEVVGKQLKQAKLHRNDKPKGQVRDAILKWCQKNDINIENCADVVDGLMSEEELLLVAEEADNDWFIFDEEPRFLIPADDEDAEMIVDHLNRLENDGE